MLWRSLLSWALGFAMAKFIGLGGLPILVGRFLPPALDWLPGLFPPYMVAKAYWL